jgi:hypothetical protein
MRQGLFIAGREPLKVAPNPKTLNQPAGVRTYRVAALRPGNFTGKPGARWEGVNPLTNQGHPAMPLRAEEGNYASGN